MELHVQVCGLIGRRAVSPTRSLFRLFCRHLGGFTVGFVSGWCPCRMVIGGSFTYSASASLCLRNPSRLKISPVYLRCSVRKQCAYGKQDRHRVVRSTYTSTTDCIVPDELRFWLDPGFQYCLGCSQGSRTKPRPGPASMP